MSRWAVKPSFTTAIETPAQRRTRSIQLGASTWSTQKKLCCTRTKANAARRVDIHRPKAPKLRRGARKTWHPDSCQVSNSSLAHKRYNSELQASSGGVRKTAGSRATRKAFHGEGKRQGTAAGGTSQHIVPRRKKVAHFTALGFSTSSKSNRSPQSFCPEVARLPLAQLEIPTPPIRLPYE